VSRFRVALWKIVIAVLVVLLVFLIALFVAVHRAQTSGDDTQDRAAAKAAAQARKFGADLAIVSTPDIPDRAGMTQLAVADHVTFIVSSVRGSTMTVYVVSSAAYGTLFGAGEDALCFRVVVTGAGTPAARGEVAATGGSCNSNSPLPGIAVTP